MIQSHLTFHIYSKYNICKGFYIISIRLFQLWCYWYHIFCRIVEHNIQNFCTVQNAAEKNHIFINSNDRLMIYKCIVSKFYSLYHAVYTESDLLSSKSYIRALIRRRWGIVFMISISYNMWRKVFAMCTHIRPCIVQK